MREGKVLSRSNPNAPLFLKIDRKRKGRGLGEGGGGGEGGKGKAEEGGVGDEGTHYSTHCGVPVRLLLTCGSNTGTIQSGHSTRKYGSWGSYGYVVVGASFPPRAGYSGEGAGGKVEERRVNMGREDIEAFCGRMTPLRLFVRTVVDDLIVSVMWSRGIEGWAEKGSVADLRPCAPPFPACLGECHEVL